MEIISFQPHDETLRPITKKFPVTHAKNHNVTEDVSVVLNTKLAALLEYTGLDGLIDACCANKNNPITMKTELDGISDGFSYEQMDLRRSKRLKTQPERFTSYDKPNFDRDKWKRHGASSTKQDNSQRASYRDSSLEVDSSCEEVPANITPHQAGAGAFVVKENPSSTKEQHKSTATRTPGKEKPSSVEVKEKSTIQERVSDSHIPQIPRNNTEKNHRPTTSLHRKSFTSSRSLNGKSEPAFGQKSARKRKERMSKREYKRMIDQCIGNIQTEMERDFEFPPDVPVMNNDQGAYREEDFTWPSPATSEDEKDSQDEKDDLDDLWKEMDYSLTTLALLEQKQVCLFLYNFLTLS
jgi:DNA repair and recombination RAD54-like protein